MGQFTAGDNPADHTVREVVEYLKSDDATPDEYERVMAAERERDGGGRAGIISMSGTEDAAPAAGAVTDPAGPNEAATGQESPADRAKDVDDPQASGDAGTTAEQYPADAPASLGPDMPQSQAEADAHAATLAAAAVAEVSDVNRPKTQTPEEALKLAGELAQRWKTPANDSEDQ